LSERKNCRRRQRRAAATGLRRAPAWRAATTNNVTQRYRAERTDARPLRTMKALFNHRASTAYKDLTMKLWLKRTLIGIFGASVLFGGLAACSHRTHGGYGWQAMSEEDAAKMKAKMIDKVGSRLELDEAQKAKLGVLADKLREQRNALIGNTTDPRAEFASLVAGPSFDRAKAKTLVDAKTGAITAKSPEVITAMADFYDSLKPEQQAKVREFMARRGHHGWRG
jgi:Spy/CpxP family protein refolding chaperone